MYEKISFPEDEHLLCLFTMFDRRPDTRRRFANVFNFYILAGTVIVF
jgi:hypothetical protein